MKTLGVILKSGLRGDASWSKIDSSFVGASLHGTHTINLDVAEIPSKRLPHDLHSFVTREGESKWVNSYALSRPQRLGITDILLHSGYTLQAHLFTAFPEDEPTLILFGCGEDPFGQAALDRVVSDDQYNSEVRFQLLPSLELSAEVLANEARLTVKLLEADGTYSTRSGVTLYWEVTGGYLPASRTDTIDGQSHAVLKDFGPLTKVKVGFKNYPSKTELVL